MEENNSSKFLFLDEYKSNPENDYMNFAKRNENNFRKYDKFKTRDPKSKIQNELKDEENKLKIMLYSLLQSEIKDSRISENNEPKNFDILSPIKRNINRNIFSTTIYNFDKNKNRERSENKKNIKKIKNNKIQKETVKSSSCDKISSMDTIVRKQLISKNKIKKNSNIEDSSFRSNISGTKSKLSNLINKNINVSKEKQKKSGNSKNKIFNYSQDNITTNKNNSTYSVCKLDKSKISNKTCQIRNKNELDKSCNFSEKSKLFLKLEKKIKRLNKKNSITPKKINKSTNFSIKRRRTSFITPKNKNYKRKKKWHTLSIKQIKKIIIKNMIIRPEEELNNHRNISDISLISDKINNSNFDFSPIQKIKHFPSSKYENKFKETLTRILKSKNSSNNESITFLKSIKTDEKTDIDNSIKKIISNSNQKYRILLNKKIIYDSLDDEESEETELDNVFINPNSKFCLLFDLVLFCLTIIYSIIVPYYLANYIKIDKNNDRFFFHSINYFLDVYYLIDIILSLFKAFYNFDEQLIKNSKLIVINYIKSWFLTDLIEAIPFYSIFQIYESNNETYNKFHYLFLCIKMIKLCKIIKCNQAYKKICDSLENNNFFLEREELIIKIFTILLFFHFGACISIFIGKNSYPNWIMCSNLNFNNFNEIYITAIYSLMTTMTTVGYGDITSYSFPEKLFQIILLIFGLIAYSWIVSSVSNFIEKMNNYLVDLEEKKKLLNEIKLHHPNMSMKVYNEVLRYLKYKNHIDKNNKNIIFDCLPLSLKNVLIYEMYKPIITKFIFFKNFDNIDFIVKVILAFRPVIAVKNDVIINEGDIIEEIVFIKRGVLTLQLPINYENPLENISKYSSMNLFNSNIDMKSLINNSSSPVKIHGNLKNTILEKLNVHEKSNIYNYSSIYNTSFINKKIFKTDYKNNIKYIKIINIRENEHFGEVLMFTEQRSPLRLKVRSNKAELFLLKKVDAVKISIEYKNIWRRINKKSVYNFEQMKKSIQKIIEVSSLNFRAIESNYIENSDKHSLKNDNSSFSPNKKKKKSENINSPIINIIEKKASNQEEDTKLKEETDSREITINKKYISSTEIFSSSNSSKEEEKDNKKLNIFSKIIDVKINNCETASQIPIKFDENKEKIKIKFNYRRNTGKRNKTISIKLNKNCDFFKDVNKNNKTFINHHLTNDLNINLTPFKEEEINQEIYPNEIFEINITSRNSEFLSVNNFAKFNIGKKNNFYNKSSKIQMILDTNISDFNPKNEIKKNDEKNLITKEANFNIKSSYENLNSLSHYIYINNDNLQNKIKNFFNKKISKLSMSPKKSDIKLLLSSPLNSIEKFSYCKKKSPSIKNKFKEDNKVFICTKSLPSSSNFNYLHNKSFCSEMKRQQTYQISNSSKKHKSIKNIINLNYFYPTKIRKKESSVSSDNYCDFCCKPIRKDSSLLSQINHNILNSSRNLINPSQYYKKYFNSLINNNKKKDIDNSINKRSGRFFNLNSNFNVKTKDERKKKSSRKSKYNNLYLKDI